MKKYYKKYDNGVGDTLYEDYARKNVKVRESRQPRSKDCQGALAFVEHMLASADRIDKKGMKKYKCKYVECGKEFYSKYRRDYCPDINNTCYKNEKSNRQSVVDGLAAKIKKGLYANYKILREIQPEKGESRIDYDVPLKKGFDEHAYYGTYKNSHNDIWHMVGEYCFAISHKDVRRFLHIYKK